MLDSGVVSPAYGRDYKTAGAVEKDFRAGKDFVLCSLGTGGRYCSIRDFEAGAHVELRYNRKLDQTIVEV